MLGLATAGGENRALQLDRAVLRQPRRRYQGGRSRTNRLFGTHFSARFVYLHVRCPFHYERKFVENETTTTDTPTKAIDQFAQMVIALEVAAPPRRKHQRVIPFR